MASDTRRDCLCPVVLTRGADQQPMSTKFDMRTDPGVIRNYGKMLVSLAAVVPDGVVCFFVSYRYMDSIIAKWHDMGILQVCLGRRAGLVVHSRAWVVAVAIAASLGLESKSGNGHRTF